MAWTYTAPSQVVYHYDGYGNAYWGNTWSVTELTPDRAGYIRLRMAFESSSFTYERNGSYSYSYDRNDADTVSFGGDSVEILRGGHIFSYNRKGFNVDIAVGVGYGEPEGVFLAAI